MFKKLSAAILLSGFAYLLMLVFPAPLFAYQHSYEQFNVYSDRPIPPAIDDVLKLAHKNISQSEYYDAQQKFKVFISNDKWRFILLTRNPNAGGVVQGIVSSNVHIRESDIQANKIIPPSGWMYDASSRPLSYFLSHELTHAMQAQQDRFMILKVPGYVMEGYADYIGKKDQFDYQLSRQMLIDNHPFMRDDSPLYNRYHLAIAHLIDVQGMSIKEISRNPPNFQALVTEIKRDN